MLLMDNLTNKLGTGRIVDKDKEVKLMCPLLLLVPSASLTLSISRQILNGPTMVGVPNIISSN